MGLVQNLKNTPLSDVCKSLDDGWFGGRLRGSRAWLHKPARVRKVAIEKFIEVLKDNEPATLAYLFENIDVLERRYAAKNGVGRSCAAMHAATVKDTLMAYFTMAMSVHTAGWG
jgi:hypothetical protein